MVKALFFTVIFFLVQMNILTAQTEENGLEVGMGKGITFFDQDKMSMKFGLIVQPRLISSTELSGDETEFESSALIRRLRLKFKGFMVDPSIQYFVHLGLSPLDMESVGKSSDMPNVIFDAYIKKEFAPGTFLLFGQYKLPGNQSRYISFTTQNCLERSYAEKIFGPQRDIGLQFHHQWNLGDFYIREKVALTNGEGKNRTGKIIDDGFCSTGRLELLPLGKFSNRGEFALPDFVREKSAKLLIGGAVSYNNNSMRTRSTLGSDLFEARNITTIMADILFKLKGFSFFAEYFQRNAEDPITIDAETDAESYVVTGMGLSSEISYMITNNISLALRGSIVIPHNDIKDLLGKRYDYTFGFSRYIYKHNVKWQADVNYSDEEIPGNDNIKKVEFRCHAIISL